MPGNHDPLSGVRTGYDRWARVYDHDANPLPALEEPHVRAALGDVPARCWIWAAAPAATPRGWRSRGPGSRRSTSRR